MNPDALKKRLELNGIPFDPSVPEKLYIYFSLLKEWNNNMDLTSVPEDDEIADRHFIDSLLILKSQMITTESSLIDVGTGAGFPGMVLAIARKDLKVTLADSQQKRLKFLEKVRKETGTENTKLLHMRAEDAAKEKIYREKYDFATARALAPLNVLCEYLLPFIKIGGYALCWKGPSLEKEIESGRRAAMILGGRVEYPINCPVAGRDWDHVILPIQKDKKTPDIYPRKAGIPKNKPLG